MQQNKTPDSSNPHDKVKSRKRKGNEYFKLAEGNKNTNSKKEFEAKITER